MWENVIHWTGVNEYMCELQVYEQINFGLVHL